LIRIEKTNTDDGGSLKDDANGAARITLFDSLQQAARRAEAAGQICGG
jgi:hypothetical protein